MKPKFFKKPSDFGKWLAQNHDKKEELIVGYYKVATGKPSMTWSDSVDEALCYGWIDGIRRKHDEESYTIRFTPRRPKSIWSAVNLAKVEQLIKEKRMQPTGLAIYKNRSDNKMNGYSFEQKKEDIKLPKEFESLLKKNKKAWTFFQSQAPYYQKTATWWVISAKREETRQKRLGELIKDSEMGLRVKPLRR
ncbi:MAG: YdeI/OmpD-associated family protein [Flavipsychrobacter sp.]